MTKIWVGDADGVAQITDYLIGQGGGAGWEQGDKAVLTINGKSMTVTIGTLVTTAEIVTTLVEAFNGDSLTDLAATVQPLAGGRAIPELVNIIASNVGDTTVRLTGAADGELFGAPSWVYTAAGSGTGTIGAPSTTAGTGPNYWSNPDNWQDADGGVAAVPVAGETIRIADTDVSILYDIDQSALDNGEVFQSLTFTGQIGLARWNPLGFSEYREQFLHLGGGAAINLGTDSGPGSSRIKIWTHQATLTAMNIMGSGVRETADIPAILWQFDDTSTVAEANIVRGDVGINIMPTESASPSVIVNLRVGYATNVAGDAQVWIDKTAYTILEQGGGTITVSGNNPPASGIDVARIYDGLYSQFGGGIDTALKIFGGSVRWNSPDVLKWADIYTGGLLDCSGDMRKKAIHKLSLHAGASYLDPQRTVVYGDPADTGTFELIGCTFRDLPQFDPGPDQDYTPAIRP